MRLSTSLTLLALPLMAQAAVLEHWWNISYATANPDGVGHPLSSPELISSMTVPSAFRAPGDWRQRILAVGLLSRYGS